MSENTFRYIIRYSPDDGHGAPSWLSTYWATMASDEDAAVKLFHFVRPDDHIISVDRVDNPDYAMYGNGCLTEDEQAAARAALNANYEKARSERDEAMQEVMTMEPEDIEAMLMYRDRVAFEHTPNVEGVHIGDLFYVMWGYDQTNYDFFQVVDLRGGHTVVLREIESFSVPYGNMQGLCRPHRDHFKTAKFYAPRTRLHERLGLVINAPDHDGHILHRCKDTDVFDYSTYA